MRRGAETTPGPRHCMVVHAYYPVGETRVQREALALVDQGYEVDVICLRDEGEARRATEDGVSIYRLPVRRNRANGLVGRFLEYLAFLVLAFVKIVALHTRKRYGTVQVHNLPDFLVFAAAYPKLTGAGIILDLHDLMPEFFAARSNRGLQSLPVRLVAWQERISCRFADHVITVTDVWRETLIRRGVPSDKVSVVMNVADTRVFGRRPGLPERSEMDGQFRLIYHGTFTYRYGVDLIIEAVAKVRSRIPGIKLTLLGGGDARRDLLALRHELDLDDAVDISQDVVHANELATQLWQADVGIVPNRSDIFTDGLLPTKLMEYVAMGIPVIASRTPTMATYFTEEMVLFFQPGDADDLARCIVEVHDDRQRLKELAHEADRFNERYSWDRVAEDYVALVDRTQ